MNRTDGRNRALALSACCAVLCALCVLLAGRYEVERRERHLLQGRVESLLVENDRLRRGGGQTAEDRTARSSSGPNLFLLLGEAQYKAVEFESKALNLSDQNAMLRRENGRLERLSRRLERYEAAYPEPEAARRERRPSAPYLIRSAGRAD